VFGEQPWTRDLLLLVVVTIVSWPLGRISVHLVRRRRAEPSRESHPLRVSLDLFETCLWPLWALLLLTTGFTIWVNTSAGMAGDPFRELPMLGFFLYYRELSAATKEFLPAGDRRKRLRRIVIPLIFTLAALQQLGVLGVLLEWMVRPLLTIGQTQFSAVSLLIAITVILVFFALARLSTDFIGRRFLPGLGFDRNLSETLATLLRYILVVAGFLIALDTLGFDLSALKIAFGALGVGIGFGLQSIVNNFVSGLILLFERRVEKGDIIAAGDTEGRMLSIGLRSSVLRTRAGIEIVVPNSEIVSARVANYSLHDTLSRVDLPVGVSYSADPNALSSLLLAVAKEEAAVLESPAPDVIFTGYGDNSIDFELRVWIDDAWQIPNVKSGLYFSIWYRLAEAGIEIPFPQRDLHVRSGELKVRAVAVGDSGGDAPEAGD
jgi:small-conductance mechanosensitive channel